MVNLATLSSVFQSLGDQGSQVAQAKFAADDYRLKQILDKLGVQQAQLGIEETQERIRREKQEPSTATEEMQAKFSAIESVLGRKLTAPEKQIILGLPATTMTVDDARRQIAESMKGWTAQERSAVQPTVDYYLSQGDPEKAYQVVSQFAERIAERPPKETKVITTAGTGIPYEVMDENGRTWRISDPDLPDNLRSMVKDYITAHKEGLEQSATIEARKNAEMLERAIKVGDAAEARKQRDQIFKTAQRGVAGHSFLKTVSQEVAEADLTGGKGTTAGDMMIVEGFMQLMFGVDPKALRGSPKMMEVLLKQGGWDDRTIAMFNSAMTGGKLSQDVRNQILQAAQRQVGSWDQAVIDSGGLTSDPQVQAMVERYTKMLDQQNNLSDLGGH